MDASTRPTWHTSPICWPRRMLPCARSWFAVTFPSTAACLLATALSRDFRPMLIPAARAVLHHPGTATSATAVAPALTRAAVPLLHLNKPSTDTWIGFGVFFKVLIYPHRFPFPPWFWLGPSQAAMAHIYTWLKGFTAVPLRI